MRRLNTPLETEKLTFRNRLIYPPLYVGKADENGCITKESLDYYNEKTAGGYFSLVIVEHCFISQEGKASAGQVSIASDEAHDGLKKLVDAIHKNGTHVVLQMNHAGSCTHSEVTGHELMAPSPVKNLRQGDGIPRECLKTKMDKSYN